MNFYDVLVTSLHPRLFKANEKWERRVQARSLTAACRIAEARNPRLGVTPTTTAMAWALWPQPKGAPK